MLIQTAERAWQRRCAEEAGYFPRNALDLWWRAGKRVRPGEARELLALRMLDHWRQHATFRLSSHLLHHDMFGFLQGSEGMRRAGCLDRISVAALSAGSVHRRLRANYSGDAFSVGAGAAFGTLLGNTTDLTAVIALGGTQQVDNVYDQSGSGFGDWSNGGTARPRILNSGVLDVTANGVPTMVFDGVNDYLGGPASSVFGLTGGPAMMVVLCAKQAAANYLFATGRGTNFSAFRFGLGGSSPNSTPIIDINAGTARRTFTGSSDGFAKHCAYTAEMAAGAQVSAAVCRQDGNVLSQSALTNGTNVITLVSTATRWGCTNDSVGAAAGFLACSSNFMLFFNTILTGTDLDISQQEAAMHG